MFLRNRGHLMRWKKRVDYADDGGIMHTIDNVNDDEHDTPS